MKVSRVAYSQDLNAGKYQQLAAQAVRLGRVRSLVWDRYGSTPRSFVAVPLNPTVAPTGTLRMILRDGRVEVHYQIDDQALRSAHRPADDHTVGVDRGYTEVLPDSDGDRYGVELGELLRTRSDTLKDRNARRAKLRSIANNAAQRGDHAKAQRLHRHNLGTVKKHRQEAGWRARVRDVTYRAVNAVVDKAKVVVAEDLTRPFFSRAGLRAAMNRRLAAWTKGVTARALKDGCGERNIPLRSTLIKETEAVQ